MINIVINLLIILTFQQQKTYVKSAIGIKQRMDILQHELQPRIQNEQIRIGMVPTETGVLDDFLKFVGAHPEEDGPVKPIIVNYDKMKPKHKNLTGRATNITEPTHEPNIDKATDVTKPRHKNHLRKATKRRHKHRLRTRTYRTSTHRTSTPTHTKRSTTRHTTSKITPADVYLRRFIDDEKKNKPVKWAHCVHLITPYLKSYNELVNFHRVGVKDATVVRLIQLLATNTSSSTKEEIVSIMYQISNLSIKIYNWDINAITALFNVIIPEPYHNFRTLKAGLRSIFNRWHLNLSNIVTIRDQSRIIRPPCIKVSEMGGSTKSPKRESEYTKPTTKDSDEDC